MKILYHISLLITHLISILREASSSRERESEEKGKPQDIRTTVTLNYPTCSYSLGYHEANM